MSIPGSSDGCLQSFGLSAWGYDYRRVLGFLIAVPDACYSTIEERCTFRLKYWFMTGLLDPKMLGRFFLMSRSTVAPPAFLNENRRF